MQVDLREKVAIVTGSARRVGKAIALELARCGVHLLVHYHSSPEEEVKETLREIKSFGVEAYAVGSDLRSRPGVDQLFAAHADHFPRLDILVNSAANFQRRQLHEVTLDEWHETLDANLTAPFLCTQHAIRLMLGQENPGGVIINICDKGAIDPWIDYAHHGISKAGLLMLTRVTAATYGPEIRANAIIPGLVMKPDHLDEARWQALAEPTPLKRPGAPDDVARAVAYLAREDFLTGAVLHVDGGESV
ncbi:MAG: SDR family oxidoreductase, partial [Anaerolineae bacterium]|nr:SDR family oxidoreductase [Anaerolineae bacterium]